MSGLTNPALKAALLGRWERADSPEAPLTFGQRDAVSELGRWCEIRQLPSDLSSTDRLGVASSSITTARSASSSSTFFPPPASSTASKRSDADGKTTTSCSSKRVETGLQFLEWFHQVEVELQRRDDAHIHAGVRSLEQLLKESAGLVDRTEEGLNNIQVLENQYKLASNGTNALNAACQHLMAEQTKMSEFSDKLAEKLNHFVRVERIIQKLNSPSMSVMSDAFPKLLDEIDESSAFLEQHAHYKQSRAYAVKYGAALSRALGMVRSHVKMTLENLTAQAGEQQNDNYAKGSNDSVFSSIYGKFRAQAPRLSELIRLLETRATSPPDETPMPICREYESALLDCRGVYLDCRRQLMSPGVRAAINDLSAKHRRDHCGLVRSTCAFLLHICEDEYQLYRQFFHSESQQFNAFLEGLCVMLYDTLRPLIIHLQHLETLSELTSILRSEVLGQHIGTNSSHLEPFESAILQLLQDVQERLVYRAHIYIRTDILGYTPHPGDLSYPEKLEMMESIAESISSQEAEQPGLRRKNSNSSIVSLSSMEVAQINGRTVANSNSPADLHGMWYPTVRRTLVCLSKLYRCLEREIFQGLSQQALSACMISVETAAQIISRQKTVVDGQLFHIKHLLILREQIAPFQVQLAVLEKSLDFSRLKSVALSLFSKQASDPHSQHVNNGILDFLLDGTTPDVREHCRDSRKEVDRKLKVVCEAFIDGATRAVVGQIKDFLSQVKLYRKDNVQLSLKNQPWARCERLQQLVSESQRNLRKFFPQIQRSMQLYLAHRETEFILFRPIRNNVMSIFIAILQLLRADFTEDEQVIVACPSQEQISVLMTSLLMTSQSRSQRPSVSTGSPPAQSNQQPLSEAKTNGQAVESEAKANGQEAKPSEAEAV